MEAPNPTWQALKKKKVRYYNIYIYIYYADGASKNILIQVVVNSLELDSSQ